MKSRPTSNSNPTTPAKQSSDLGRSVPARQRSGKTEAANTPGGPLHPSSDESASSRETTRAKKGEPLTATRASERSPKQENL